MTKEYIEREKALEKVIEVKHHDPELSGVVLHRYIKEIDLKDIPAADVVEVRHERWERVIPTKSAAKWSTKVSCSNCHSVGYMRYNYCPNCGAKMDKEVADDKKQPEEAPGE